MYEVSARYWPGWVTIVSWGPAKINRLWRREGFAILNSAISWRGAQRLLTILHVILNWQGLPKFSYQLARCPKTALDFWLREQLAGLVLVTKAKDAGSSKNPIAGGGV